MSFWDGCSLHRVREHIREHDFHRVIDVIEFHIERFFRLLECIQLNQIRECSFKEKNGDSKESEEHKKKN